MLPLVIIGSGSGKRDSDPRPQPWQGCALPTELFPQISVPPLWKLLFPTLRDCKYKLKNLFCKIFGEFYPPIPPAGNFQMHSLRHDTSPGIDFIHIIPIWRSTSKAVTINSFNNIGINIEQKAPASDPAPYQTKKTDVPSGTSACLLSAKFSES